MERRHDKRLKLNKKRSAQQQTKVLRLHKDGGVAYSIDVVPSPALQPALLTKSYDKKRTGIYHSSLLCLAFLWLTLLVSNNCIYEKNNKKKKKKTLLNTYVCISMLGLLLNFGNLVCYRPKGSSVGF